MSFSCPTKISILLLLLANSAVARSTRVWSYQELQDESDVVVIAEVSLSKCVKNTGSFDKKYYTQLETTFKTHLVLKGEIKGDSLIFVHYRNTKAGGALSNGARLVEFQIKKNNPRYLLFLKYRKDGKYEAISGQIDPIESVDLLAVPDGPIRMRWRPDIK